ncbi:hypothetical protein BB559_004794 [Furculomyces boomerangus]|uniref:Helicase C-terminal domain-containing protein n=1 Tax=Furculomyces boomerangus TaxID=61424 RepID=A0A2T9YCN9_9FUNG|nr:hypothetical protein BB559_004794 [Furculomyces boomerangus]
MSLDSQINLNKRNILFSLESGNISILVLDNTKESIRELSILLYKNGWAAENRMIGCILVKPKDILDCVQKSFNETSNIQPSIIGYDIDFEKNNTSEYTKIKYTTPNSLFRNITTDPLLTKFSILIVSDFEYRVSELDLLIMILKKIQKKRPDLKIIFTVGIEESALPLVEYFGKSIESTTQNNDTSSKINEKKTLPISVINLLTKNPDVDIHYLEKPSEDYFNMSISLVKKIHESESKKGDIILFLPSRNEVEKAVQNLNVYNESQKTKNQILSVPLYAGLNSKDMDMTYTRTIFNTRKVVISTNIAETMDPIDGISFVIDTGLKKETIFDTEKNTEIVNMVPISKNSARIRTKMANLGSGANICGKSYRLYSYSTYKNHLPELDLPEMNRIGSSKLSKLLLKLLFLAGPSFRNAKFDMIEPGLFERNIESAVEKLISFGCFESGTESDRKSINNYDLIKKMTLIDIEPQLVICLVEALKKKDKNMSIINATKNFETPFFSNSSEKPDFDVSTEILVIIAMLNTGNLFTGPNSLSDDPNHQKLKFATEEGDLILYLNIFVAFLRFYTSNRNNIGRIGYWCKKHNMDINSLMNSLKIAKRMMLALGLVANDNSCESYLSNRLLAPLNSIDSKRKTQLVIECFIKGFYENVAQLQDDNFSYKNIVTGKALFIHPNSCLFSITPKFVLYTGVIETSKAFMLQVSKIEPEWLVGLGNPQGEGTRHNVGMYVLDLLVQNLGLSWGNSKKVDGKFANFKTKVRLVRNKNNKFLPSQSTIGSPMVLPKGVSISEVDYDIYCLKPNSFMNLSGKSVKDAAKIHGISPDSIIVFHDDMERELGIFSYKKKGSAGGHNGIKSIISYLGTQDFARVRIGIGRPDGFSKTVIDHVLSSFKKDQLVLIDEVAYTIARNWQDILVHPREI